MKDSSSSSSTEKMETLSQLLTRTINQGAPLYNQGQVQECFQLYLETAQFAIAQPAIAQSCVGQRLEHAIDEAAALGASKEYNEGAWVLRRGFDDILDAADPSQGRRASLLLIASSTTTTHDMDDKESDDARSYWQEEAVLNTSDAEKGQALADIAYILRASIRPRQYTRYTRTFENCFPATQAVETLTALGLAAHRTMATTKLQALYAATFLRSVSHPGEAQFQDGTHLYRFANRQELQDALRRLEEEGPALTGTERNVQLIALRTTLDLPLTHEEAKENVELGGENDDGAPSQPASRSTSIYWKDHSMADLSTEHARGRSLATLTAKVERLVEVKDRKYNFKTYPQCFVGSEAVEELVKADVAITREEAVQQLDQLVQVGLVHHVTRDHLFKDKRLFYNFTAVKDLKNAIDAMAKLPTEPTGQDLVRLTALVSRYKQFAGLNITSILNKFFGCDTQEGWDLVDLQNWRNNMKRWGFGRREDQDDEMVEALAPLVVNIDPETWNVEGDEEWESPYGILAQIAIFDQIPRSAFRGTPDAFKWDHLAIRATKVALEKGYFETAFKSTLNQFLLLLPLEHSESWEDQKLGVSLLLQLLSTVAIQDEDLSDYEIVKRLEFSKRLTTAFLEHAQVIAKFKRYPHRNKPLGRTTSLEERIWLASDLVPRWAKSQQPEDQRNVIQLPVIPLKRFTKGR